MKVWELIEKLEQLNPEAEACYDDKEWGISDIVTVKEETIVPYSIDRETEDEKRLVVVMG